MEPFVVSLATAAFTALTGAVAYLFRENTILKKQESQCRENLATMRAELTSLNALVQQMQWSGVNRIEAVIVADASSGYIIEWNPGATILLHWTEREMLGKPIHRIMPDRYKDKHNEALRALLSSNRIPQRGPIVGHAITKDGVEIPVEITLSGWRNGNTVIVGASIKRRVEPLQVGM